MVVVDVTRPGSSGADSGSRLTVAGRARAAYHEQQVLSGGRDEKIVPRRLHPIRVVPAIMIVIGALIAGTVGTSVAEQPESAVSAGATPISSAELMNLAYPNVWPQSGIAPLAGGSYSEPAVLGSASQIVVQFQRAAFGRIDGQAVAAVVLSVSGGGSGMFYDLYLVRRTADGALEPVAQRNLGDRVRLQGLSFVGEAIRVDFTGFAVNDPLCCPTLNVAQELRLHDRELELVRAREVPALLPIPEGGSLIGWYGGPTTSSAILASAPPLASVWGYDRIEDSWTLDSRELPPAMRDLIPVERGTGLFVLARWATEIPVPLLPAPAPCPLNPGPPNPVNPSMLVQRPGSGELIGGPVAIAGRARAFEGNVRIRILSADGVTLADTFTTATVGGPYFGDFEVAVPVAVTEETAVCVQVFENSAFDGSQINVVQIGIKLRPAP